MYLVCRKADRARAGCKSVYFLTFTTIWVILRKLLALYTERGIETAIFCGDFAHLYRYRCWAVGWNGALRFGNGDGDRFAINSIYATSFPNLKLHGEYAELALGGR